ncbi:hypothetical protein [Burkholderia sp. PAMC 26561]|uniref:hypothetical protein n=1 Tax=Burkholderia sp. PAMC 26561 TaxID=1795043 RepID=UPI00076B0C05|nr:hypothetical protein [Burkholderia sp. PAMC 26561]AME28681.2 hypothetical protein AXG89_33375 [Burkholderia sp. PAMC 26561]
MSRKKNGRDDMWRNLTLHAKITVLRIGWPVIGGAFALLVCSLGSLLVYLAGESSVASARAELVVYRNQASTVRRARVDLDPVDRNGLAFYAVLSNTGLIEPRLATLFDQSSKNGLIVKKASYETQWIKDGGFGQYTIVCPVEGTYSAIHRFIRQALSDIPNLSLDDIEFKRNNVASSVVEAKLHLTLYVNDKPADRVVTAQSAPSTQAAALAMANVTNVTLDLPPLPEGLR